MLINEIGFDFIDEYEFEIIFLLEYEHSFKGCINLSLGYADNEKGEKDYFILYKRNFGSTKKIEIADVDGQHIEKIIKYGKVSIKPPEAFGLDGYSYVFTFFNNGNFAQYRWWGKPDKNWGVFGEIVDIVFKYVKNNHISSNLNV